MVGCSGCDGRGEMQWFFSPLAAGEAAEEIDAEREENDIWKPDEDRGKGVGLAAKGICHDDKKEVSEGNGKAECKADGGFLAVSGNAKRDGDEAKRNAGKCGGEALIQLDEGLGGSLTGTLPKHLDKLKKRVGTQSPVGSEFFKKLLK